MEEIKKALEATTLQALKQAKESPGLETDAACRFVDAYLRVCREFPDKIVITVDSQGRVVSACRKIFNFPGEEGKEVHLAIPFEINRRER